MDTSIREKMRGEEGSGASVSSCLFFKKKKEIIVVLPEDKVE